MMGLWWRLSLLGLIGVASLALAPIEEWFPTGMDPVSLRLLATLQPAVLVIVMAALGAWAAPKVGLDAPATRAWAERRPVLPELRRQLPAAIIAGLVIAAILLAYVALLRPTQAGAELLRFVAPLTTRLLYGGIVEELLTRWGLMSLLVWLAWRLARRPPAVPSFAYWTGIVGAALLFALGHLPALYLLMPNPPGWLLVTILAANLGPGLLLGWLFWRRGLEAAMMAHGLAHLFAALAIALVY